MGRFNILERRVERFVQEPPTVRGATAVIVTATAVVVFGAGVLMTLIDSKEYPTFGIGLWWAVQTVTTVGYGDYVPHNVAGRAVATLVMLGGIGFLTVITAAITSGFVARSREERSRRHDAPPSEELLQEIIASLRRLENARNDRA